MVNFSFERELETATSRIGKIILPEEPHKTIAFIFCLLNLLDDKKINFNQFLNKYYSDEEGGSGPYSNFCNKVVLRFKNVIVATLLGEKVPEIEEKEEIKTAPVNFNNELIERLTFLVKDYIHPGPQDGYRYRKHVLERRVQCPGRQSTGKTL